MTSLAARDLKCKSDIRSCEHYEMGNDIQKWVSARLLAEFLNYDTRVFHIRSRTIKAKSRKTREGEKENPSYNHRLLPKPLIVSNQVLVFSFLTLTITLILTTSSFGSSHQTFISHLL